MDEADFAIVEWRVDFDILEWRVDHYADLSNVESVIAAGDLSNVESVIAAAKILRETMPEKPLLFTFRSAKEGGEQAISTAGDFHRGLYCTQSCSHRQRPG